MAPELRLVERRSVGRDGLRRLLDDLSVPGVCRNTVYLSPGPLGPSTSRPALEPGADSGALSEARAVAGHVGESDTGTAVFICDERTVAVAPPFPIQAEHVSHGADRSPLDELLTREMVVGVILLRLGHYAVAVLEGDRLAASKTGSRYVKSRHRAGGSSQRRFERSRERLQRELYDSACRLAEEIFSPFDGRLDYLLLGGERYTLLGFARRCGLMQRLAPITLRRTVAVDRPGQKAMERMPYEVWKSQVYVFARGDRG
jgi:hypothetical protein